MQDFLATNSTRALNVVANFIGLPKFAWRKLDIISNSVTQNLHETIDDLPVDRNVLTRLQTFYDSFPHTYYDHVHEHGFWGCRPNVGMSEVVSIGAKDE